MVAKGWVGIDLDGTLARYEKFVSSDHIGEPVPAMQAFVRQLIADGKDVRIFTARVAPATVLYNATQEEAEAELNKVVVAIAQWSYTHLGKMLPVTATKDFMMIKLYDDRCIQIVPNEGIRADGLDL